MNGNKQIPNEIPVEKMYVNVQPLCLEYDRIDELQTIRMEKQNTNCAICST